MRRTTSRTRNDDERILPLINVVFLLLIFFMLAGKIAAGDPIPAEPPRSASEAASGARELVIVMGADGRIAFDGAVIERSAIGTAVATSLGGDEPPQIWLKADSDADSVEVVAVMETLREAGVERLKLLTTPAPVAG